MRAILGFAAVLMLAACAAEAADERGWSFYGQEESVGARYGMVTTDEVQVSFYCQRGTDRLGLLVFVAHRPRGEAPPPWKTEMTLTIGRKSFVLPAGATEDGLSDGSLVEFQAPTDAPVFKALAATGRAKFSAYDETYHPPAFDRTAFAAMLRDCKGAKR